jgi:hypothetical protein
MWAAIAVLIFVILVSIGLLIYHATSSDTSQPLTEVEIISGRVASFSNEILMRSSEAGNLGTLYQRPIYHGISSGNRKDRFYGSYPLSLKQAMIVWGYPPVTDRLASLPQNLPIYWSITGYLYSTQSEEPWASVGDSYSSGRDWLERAKGEQIAFIFTANPNIYRLILGARLEDPALLKRIFGASWNRLIYLPIFIPSSMYDPSYRYDLLLRTISPTGKLQGESGQRGRSERSESEANPSKQRGEKWETVFVTFPQIPESRADDVHIIPRSSQNSELNLASMPEWTNFARQIVKYEGYDILSMTLAQPYLSPTIPGGYDRGQDCLIYQQNCRADNRDATYLVASNINLRPGEELAVVALDHLQTGKGSAFSNLNFYDQTTGSPYRTEYTGISTNRLPMATQLCEATQLIINRPPADVFHDGRAIISVGERIYVDHASGVGPAYDSILPAIVFTVRKRSGS